MRKLLISIVVLALLALGAAGWAAWQIVHQCNKQCDWGDERCQKMCVGRHYCPAHPDGL
jgi:hypothetical protein